MTLTASTLDAVARALPGGYRAREFVDADREPLTVERNAELPEVEQESAAEWRIWDNLIPDPSAIRIVVESAAGDIAAFLNVSNGGPFKAPDGSARGSLNVARAHRRRGIGAALVPLIEAEARRLSAPKLYGGVSARDEDAFRWAQQRGYREIGRRIEAAIDLDPFDAGRWSDRVSRATQQGIRFITLAELRSGMTDERLEGVLHEIYDLEEEAWADVPIAGPFPHWGYETFRKLLMENPGSAFDLDVLAYDADRLVAFTTSYRNMGGRKGGTVFTGVRRSHRGRGIAFALKVDALGRAKASGLRWMLTTNDEPNKAMRGINYALGYAPLPANIQLEKTL